MKTKPLVVILLLLSPIFLNWYFRDKSFDATVLTGYDNTAKASSTLIGTEIVTLEPTDDSFVTSFWPDDTNNGPTLEIRADKFAKWLIERIYLKFDLKSIDCSRICGAALYLNCYAGFPPGPIPVDACKTIDYFKGTTAPWKEIGLTWNNAPDVGDTIVTIQISVQNGGGWNCWSGDAMTNYVKTECSNDGIVSFVIKFTVEECPQICSRSRDFYSKEWYYGHPYLEISLAPSIESCDSKGVKKDSFNLNENVYANGTGYSPSKTYDLYIVNDVPVWSDGMTIPTPVITTKVSSDSSGKIVPTLVWNKPLTLGKYDIVVDVNGNGKYDLGVDALDDSDIMVTAGFLVIPEYWQGTILGLAGCFAAFGVFHIFKRKRVGTRYLS